MVWKTLDYPVLLNWLHGIHFVGKTTGEFHDTDFAEVDFGTFGFEAEVAFAEAGFADAVYEFAVDGEFYGAIDGDHDVAVPLAFGEAAVFEGFAAGTSWVVGDGFHAASSEEFAVDIGQWARNSVAGMDEGPLQFEHLDFHAFGETVAFGAGITPEKDS